VTSGTLYRVIIRTSLSRQLLAPVRQPAARSGEHTLQPVRLPVPSHPIEVTWSRHGDVIVTSLDVTLARTLPVVAQRRTRAEGQCRESMARGVVGQRGIYICMTGSRLGVADPS